MCISAASLTSWKMAGCSTNALKSPGPSSTDAEVEGRQACVPLQEEGSGENWVVPHISFGFRFFEIEFSKRAVLLSC